MQAVLTTIAMSLPCNKLNLCIKVHVKKASLKKDSKPEKQESSKDDLLSICDSQTVTNFSQVIALAPRATKY